MRIAVMLIVMTVLIELASFNISYAHCEVPCGIYTDELRVEMIAEDITTIEKAMKQIETLGSKENINYNQLVRWINTKEDHANKIQEIVTQYFMTQRIKPDQKKYEEKLKSLHTMLILAMKCKQSTDLEQPKKLTAELEKFKNLYFEGTHNHNH